ncbi:conserved membrane protein of unknown function [Petrocella atlantisensis]|uniref:Uncharacterized protein n=1 Tax=Petrocella atlantisensis TaxID=2173034 RepID=A0A3P7PA88_9FIRM|nr:conserved membrane protein of unknown function [Petrocella atlantisensis]
MIIKIKSYAFRLFMYSLVIAAIIYSQNYFRVIFLNLINGGKNPYWFILLVPFAYIISGILISFERIFTIMRTQGALTYDWIRFTVIVIPFLILSCWKPLSLYYSSTIARLFGDPFRIFIIHSEVLLVIQVLTGFLIVSCISRHETLNKEVER